MVLYSLPELDGAIDSIPLGGLVSNDIHLVPERVDRLAARIKKWVSLRHTPPKVCLSAFPAYALHRSRKAIAILPLTTITEHGTYG